MILKDEFQTGTLLIYNVAQEKWTSNNCQAMKEEG